MPRCLQPNPSSAERTVRIRALNDDLRQTLPPGCVFVTTGVSALGSEVVREILERVRCFAAFTPDNDPHGEHDFGSLAVADQTVFFKIDCYDPTGTYHSEDEADPALTRRALTIMLADEY